MDLTSYHAKYYAHELTVRHSAGELGKLAGTLVDAQVDMNPHQVDAALFAFKSPFSNGAILADEVGLGKTIEAGLVISQRWAERKRRILIITPSSLRKQWLQELQEKFFLDSHILESKSYRTARKSGHDRPFECDDIVICSYHFARNKADDIGVIPWDLVVIDEAHRLRNVYKKSNKIANELRNTLEGVPKLLLTATPLQNTLLELYGLVSFIDPHIFGDMQSFREQFADFNKPRTFERLKERIAPVCQRTLRSQVLPYIRYTARRPILEEFTPTPDEETLYLMVSDYLRRPQLFALPTGQRQLIVLVLRKLLASSTHAIAGALLKMANRLQKRLDEAAPANSFVDDSFVDDSFVDDSFVDELDEDFEHLDEVQEEIAQEEIAQEEIAQEEIAQEEIAQEEIAQEEIANGAESPTDEQPDEREILTTDQRHALETEIAELRAFYELAISIEQNAKGVALLKALDTAFAQAKELGAAQKALIFTESRRTQEYLNELLQSTPYANHIVLFNGTNDDDKSKQIYKEWLEQHKETDRVTGSRTADMRAALVDYFRDRGQIMIATEAGAEGINLQFCSLIVNYDLPWNPQRVEQRIGRCHRYGQKYDVVVVNFLNQKNAADRRVFELLDEKFQLFQGVFGASDEVLGAVESGVSFEKRIAEIYQNCRSAEEINASFDQLQKELSAEITDAMHNARQTLLENFDDEVKEKLRLRNAKSQEYLNRYERMLMRLTEYELNGYAHFTGDSSFELNAVPDWVQPIEEPATRPHPTDLATNGTHELMPAIPLGLYELPRRSGNAHFYRMVHPLAQNVLQKAKLRTPDLAQLTFDYTNAENKITQLESLTRPAGWLKLSQLTVDSPAQSEDTIIWAGVTDDGQPLETDLLSRLFTLPAEVGTVTEQEPAILQDKTDEAREKQLADISKRNAIFFEDEINKLEAWADDRKIGLEREIKDYDRRIKEARRLALAAQTLEEKLAAQKEVKALEKERNNRRRTLFEAQDQIDDQRDKIIEETEAQLQQTVSITELFTIRWHII